MASADLQSRLQELWRKFAPETALHCHVVLFQSHRLVVFAETPAHANALRMRTESLTGFLQQAGLPIKTMEIKTRPVNLPEPVKAKKAFKISQRSASAILDLADRIQTPSVKSALQRLATRKDRSD